MSTEELSQRELREMLRNNGVAVDPSDHRSDTEILQALGYLPLEGTVNLDVAESVWRE